MINLSPSEFIFTLFFEFFTFLVSFYYFINQHKKTYVLLSFAIGLPLATVISIYFGVLSYVFLFLFLLAINHSASKSIFTIYFLFSFLIINLQGLLYNQIQIHIVQTNFKTNTKIILFLYSISFLLTAILLAPLLKYIYNNFICQLTQYSKRKGKMYFILLAFLLFFMLIIISFSQYTDKFDSNNMPIISTISIAFFILIIGIINISIKRIQYKIKIEKEEEELKQLILYTDRLEDNQQQLRKFKHDYLNILLSLQSSIQEENIDEIKKTFCEINIYSKNILNKYDTNTADLANIKIPAIKSIFASKFLSWEASIIDTITFECVDLMNNFYMDDIVLVRIIGNLLDNAYEEIQTQNSTDKFIHIAIIDNNDNIEIIINNSIEKKLPHLSILNKSAYSTKNNHLGVGLSNIQNLISLQKNIYQITKIDNDKKIYSTTLLIEKN